MTHESRMLIITSNQDLISELSSKKTPDTRVIHLNENNNFLDFTFAQLTELNSKNDQMYKRVLDSPQTSRSKMAKIFKKSTDLVCVICGDYAIGFNYDLLTCASCKAFFRRNAQYEPNKLRCLTGENHCSVNFKSARRCQRCRLEKCLNLGMRKDFIISEEEKQKRRQRLEENRLLSNEFHSSSTLPITNIFSQEISQNFLIDSKHEDLSIEDWITIDNIRSNYSSIFSNEKAKTFSFNMSDRISALIYWSEIVNERILKLISYFRQIDEFEQLNLDDRFLLIKYNLHSLYLIQRCLKFNLTTGSFCTLNDEERLKRQKFFHLCYGTSGMRDSFKNLMKTLATVTEQDLTLIELILIVLLFSKGLSMNENEPLLKENLTVFRVQSHYLTLTWNYLIYKQGYSKTIQQFTRLFTEITRIQSVISQYRQFFRSQFQSTDAVERFPPLMQAVLHIT
ncbi:unnamed protein product [Adineta ricciae]|uniref:Uncharacterized protein n=1 Tax=Adineta ricciae TaxID=249248 RepID=A0A814E247_ADIRI|nr:unnamed protein product [Adineta ricciae]CAF1239644.1 unnamed protein product [Adineta ricciae]